MIYRLIIALTFIPVVLSGQEMKSSFPLKWKQEIGKTTYRTNMVFDEEEGKIYIGSNGEDLNSDNDPLDGVHVINGASGERITHFTMKALGDNDVNGIAISGDKLFYGTDSDYLFCIDRNTGEEQWKYALTGDVESTPRLSDLNNDGEKDVVVNVQTYGLVAVDGTTGQLIWENKVLVGDGNVTPAMYDLNADGVQDFLSGGRLRRGEPQELYNKGFYGDSYVAVDGKTGSVLWSVGTGSGVHASPMLIVRNDTLNIHTVDSYGSYKILNREGEVLLRSSVGIGKFGSPVVTWPDYYLVIGNSWFGSSDDFSAIPIDRMVKKDQEGNVLMTSVHSTNQELEYETGKISATAVVADVLQDETGQEVLIPTEKGELLITSGNGELLERLKLPAGAEATPLIKDVDGDGKLEILIAMLDGYLYCYETDSGGSVMWGGFLGAERGGILLVDDQ